MFDRYSLTKCKQNLIVILLLFCEKVVFCGDCVRKWQVEECGNECMLLFSVFVYRWIFLQYFDSIRVPDVVGKGDFLLIVELGKLCCINCCTLIGCSRHSMVHVALCNIDRIICKFVSFSRVCVLGWARVENEGHEEC